MKISIIHPSRSRPLMATITRARWLTAADNRDNIEYILSLDTDDPDRKHYIQGNRLLNNNTSAIAAINYAAYYATGDLLIAVSDDFNCPEHWDTLLLQALEGKEDFLVKTQDGLQPTLITLPIMDRKYYERFGYVYYPGYRHMFADTEMTAVGHLLGKVINVPLLFEHMHHSVGKSKKDAVNVRANNTWNQGKKLFNQRLANNFDIERPIKNYSDIKWR